MSLLEVMRPLSLIDNYEYFIGLSELTRPSSKLRLLHELVNSLDMPQEISHPIIDMGMR